MIQAYTLFTLEADLPDVAVREMREQLADISLREHSAGIVICHPDYVENGVVSALTEALPFPLIGITTFYQTSPKGDDLFALSVTVLTSDDARFSIAYGDLSSAPESEQTIVCDTCRKALEHDGGQPSLLVSFLSADRPISGDEYLRRLDAASGGVPAFGFVNSGETDVDSNIYMMCGSAIFSRGTALLAITGDFDADMYVSATPESRLLALSSTVTAGEGCVVREINGQPAVAYLKRNGIILDDALEGDFLAIPFYCRMPGDEGFVGRTLQTVFADGSLGFMAEVPVGTLLRIDTVTVDDILAESRMAIQNAVRQSPDASLFLVGSCVGRFITMGLDTTAEMDHATAVIPAGRNYLACYVGGEICPAREQGALVNRYHNNSLIVLALR